MITWKIVVFVLKFKWPHFPLFQSMILTAILYPLCECVTVYLTTHLMISIGLLQRFWSYKQYCLSTFLYMSSAVHVQVYLTPPRSGITRKIHESSYLEDNAKLFYKIVVQVTPLPAKFQTSCGSVDFLTLNVIASFFYILLIE